MMIVLTTLVLPLVAAAQRPVPVRRIALLEVTPTPFLEGLRHALRERGWAEGHNLAIEWRSAEGNLDQILRWSPR
jgi:hypothetical protein